MTTLHTVAALAALAATLGLSPAQASDDPTQTTVLHSAGLQQALPRYADTTASSYIRNDRYVLQLTDDGFLHLYELDQHKAAALQTRLAGDPQGRLKFEQQLPGTMKRSIWKFDLRMGLAQAAGQSDPSALPPLPPQLLLSVDRGDVRVEAVMKPEDSPGGLSTQLPVWTLATGASQQLRLRLRANGNLTVEHAQGGVAWHTGTCGGVLRGCGEVGRPQ